MAVDVMAILGAQANSAVYFGLLEVGDTIMVPCLPKAAI